MKIAFTVLVAIVVPGGMVLLAAGMLGRWLRNSRSSAPTPSDAQSCAIG